LLAGGWIEFRQSFAGKVAFAGLGWGAMARQAQGKGAGKKR